MLEMIVTARPFDPAYGFNLIPAGTLIFAERYKGMYRLHDSNMQFVGTCSSLHELI